MTENRTEGAAETSEDDSDDDEMCVNHTEDYSGQGNGEGSLATPLSPLNLDFGLTPSEESLAIIEAKRELTQWKTLKIDVMAALKAQAATGISESLVKSKKDIIHVLRHFNTMKWHGQVSSDVAARVIGLPPFKTISRATARRGGNQTTNAKCERAFSYAKLVDSPLRRCLGPAKFELLVILGLNLLWMKENGVIDNNYLLKAMNSATDIKECRARLVEFFVEDLVGDDEQLEELIAYLNGLAEHIVERSNKAQKTS